MCLPLLILSCDIKSRSSLLAPAHPGGPGKRLCLCVYMLNMVRCPYVRSSLTLAVASSLANIVIMRTGGGEGGGLRAPQAGDKGAVQLASDFGKRLRAGLVVT